MSASEDPIRDCLEEAATMNAYESSYPGGLADRQIDRLLAAANKDLLAHVEAAADPTLTLTEIMARTARAAPAYGSAAITASGRDAHPSHLDLALNLGTQQVDASGADLSGIAVVDMNALAGVIWTPETIWPPGVMLEVRSRSREIRPGVYQVLQGNDQDRSALISL